MPRWHWSLQQSAQVDVFDTVDASWSTLSTEMPNASSDLSAFVHDGKIYVLGGRKLRKLSPGLTVSMTTGWNVLSKSFQWHDFDGFCLQVSIAIHHHPSFPSNFQQFPATQATMPTTAPLLLKWWSLIPLKPEVLRGAPPTPWPRDEVTKTWGLGSYYASEKRGEETSTITGHFRVHPCTSFFFSELTISITTWFNADHVSDSDVWILWSNAIRRPTTETHWK